MPLCISVSFLLALGSFVTLETIYVVYSPSEAKHVLFQNNGSLTRGFMDLWTSKLFIYFSLEFEVRLEISLFC